MSESQISGGRILVTGGAGFIGANLVRMLLDQGYKDALIPDVRWDGRREKVQFIEREPEPVVAS